MGRYNEPFKTPPLFLFGKIKTVCECSDYAHFVFMYLRPSSSGLQDTPSMGSGLRAMRNKMQFIKPPT
ncbi:hypothetical protein CVD19_06085 [Bacillus sp. T33-2]|nr:hypothetical protein CVD19_06085 [Bacillus sp. T33-2]